MQWKKIDKQIKSLLHKNQLNNARMRWMSLIHDMTNNKNNAEREIAGDSLRSALLFIHDIDLNLFVLLFHVVDDIAHSLVWLDALSVITEPEESHFSAFVVAEALKYLRPCCAGFDLHAKWILVAQQHHLQNYLLSLLVLLFHAAVVIVFAFVLCLVVVIVIAFIVHLCHGEEMSV